MRLAFLLGLVIAPLIFMTHAEALIARPSLVIPSSGPTGGYPSYMSLRYGVYAGGNYPHYAVTTGAGLEAKHRIQVIQQRNSNPTYRRQYVPTRPTASRYQRNYYTTPTRDHPGTQKQFYPPQRSFWGRSGYY